MQINKIELFRSIYVEAAPLSISVPLITMVGRSNVGKSSLINYLTGNYKIARTSKEPGKTRSINYYRCNEGQFFLVDLPGYGYAKVSKQMQKTWNNIINDFFSSQNRHIVLLLIDARREVTENDRIMYDYINQMIIPHTVVLTKCDYVTKSQMPIVISKISKSFHLGIDNIIPVSSKNKTGKENLLKRVSQQIESFQENL